MLARSDEFFLMHPRAGLQARGEDLGWVQKVWRIAVVNYLQARVFVAAGPGFEPGLSDSESLVLPLHHPARQRRIL
jgi:hypothetical protein